VAGVTLITHELKLGRPDELMARLDQLPGAFFLRHQQLSFCGAYPAECSHSLDPSGTLSSPAHLDPFLSGGDHELPEWVGVLPYEAFRGLERRRPLALDPRPASNWCLPTWYRYPAVVQLHDDVALVHGESREAVDRMVEALVRPHSPHPLPVALSWRTAPEPAEQHRRRILTALEAIARGDLYQVNLARRFEFSVKGGAFGLFAALEGSGVSPFGTVLSFKGQSVVSLSPELFIEASPSGRVLTRPIKGTRPRLNDAVRDAQAQKELESSEKEQAELTMVIDIERNDLGRLAEVGSVQLLAEPHVVAHPTVFHREAEIGAQLRTGTSWEQLLRTICPSGSVTGAPKVSAMDLIAQLEADRRGLYTGALGYLTRSGGLRLSMAIRTLCIEQERALYFTGGGIVADSSPQQELEETLWKAEQLAQLVQLGVALR
jgi:anthranilate/para-aminobenzoate synthase component I